MRPGYLFFVCIVFGCCSPNEKEQEKKPVENKGFDELLLLYGNENSDTIKVFSTGDIDSKTHKYNGFKLDSVDLLLFPKEFAETATEGYGFFACNKFNIDSNRIGLITRTPGEYSSSSLKLFVYHKKDKKLDYGIELADEFGDEGYVRTVSGKLFFNAGKLNCILRETQTDQHSVIDPNDTITDREITEYHIDLSSNKPDTMRTVSILNQKGYYGVNIRLIGVVKEEEFYGPPGYGENKATDAKEKVKILYLQRPIDVIAIKDGETTHKNITKIQIMTDKNLNEKTNQRWGIEGKLVEGLSGHHHTEVLLDMLDFY